MGGQVYIYGLMENTGSNPVGQVTVNASEELDGEVSGAGLIWYIGSPKLSSKVDGIGMIKKKPFSS